MPFDALKGFREIIRFVEKQKLGKKKFSSDFLYMLNDKIKALEKGMNIKVTYFFDLNYIEMCGIVKKIDNVTQNIILLNTKINFDDIMNIEILQILFYRKKLYKGGIICNYKDVFLEITDV